MCVSERVFFLALEPNSRTSGYEVTLFLTKAQILADPDLQLCGKLYFTVLSCCCQVFGYRGVILFPWLARVYDRDIPHKKDNRYLHRIWVLQCVTLVGGISDFNLCLH